MGRYRWSSRLTVEQYPVCLSAPILRGLGVFRMRGRGELEWRHETGGSAFARLNYQIDNGAGGSRTLFIHPQILSADPRWIVTGQRIELLTTRPHFGGERNWLRCNCGRRVGRLYLQTGALEFQCRQCLRLTYESARRHDATLYALAKDEVASERALSSENHLKALRGIRAFTLRLKWVRAGRCDAI